MMDYVWLIPLFPLIGFLINGLVGKSLPKSVVGTIGAAAVGLSPNYFSHLFKKVRGQGFKDHLNAVRIEKARTLLATGGHKVYEVAQMVGFSDYKYFSAVFKKVTGTSPTRR